MGTSGCISSCEYWLLCCEGSESTGECSELCDVVVLVKCLCVKKVF